MDDKLLKNENKMAEIKHNTGDGSGSMLLTASLLFANMDYASLQDYAIKAVVGGAIWMAFKIGAECIIERMKKK